MWIPVTKRIGVKREILYYNLSKDITTNKTGYIVRYTCDKCKDSHIKTTTSSSLLRSTYNSYKYQTCRSCRSRISEYEIKNTKVSYNIIADSINNTGYTIISSEEEYMESNNSSQFKINCRCIKNHLYNTTWNNWSRGKRCRKCYEDKKVEDSIKYKNGYDLYKYLVWRETNLNYKKYKNIINPNNLKRGVGQYHLDHTYSIYDGFINNILPSIVANACNLRIINGSINISKGKKSDIDIIDLLEKISIF